MGVFCGSGLLFWWVNPDGGWQPGWLRGSSLETVWVSVECDVENVSALLEERLCTAVVNALRGHEADAGVAVCAVVPLEEVLAVGARILDAAEAFGELGTVFERFELGFGVRIVVGDVRPAVGLGNLQIDQQGGPACRTTDRQHGGQT